MGGKVTEAPARRDEILAVAAELFARKGIKATTVREIADAVGVLSGSLYHHFPSKDEIAREILLRFLTAIRDRYADVLDRGEGPAQALRALVAASLQLSREQPDATAIYQNELRYLRETPGFADVQEAAAEVQRAWLRVIEQGVADGAFRRDVAPRVFHRLIRDAVWLSGRGHWPDADDAPEQLADAITTVFLEGFAAPVAAPAT